MSGVGLIGEVPPHWSVKPLRLLARFLKRSGGSKQDIVENGVPCVRYGDLYTSHNNFIERAQTYFTEDRAKDYTRIKYGDVLFAASGETIEEIGKSAVNLIHDAHCGGDVVVFRPTEPNIARFYGYAMHAAPVAAQKSLAGRGTTVKHIYPDELREEVVAVPPVGEQQAIADYLDRETARLDALVAAKERVLGLLAEKRRALITRAVTRGLDPHAPLRDSGIPWLGEIPSHWETSKFTWSVFIIEGQVDPENEPYVNMPLIAPNRVEAGTGRLHSSETAADQGASSGTYLCQRNDVIDSKIRPALRKATMALEDCLCSADMYPLRARNGMEPEFLLFFLLSEPFSTWAVLESNRVAMPKINREALSDIRIPFPPTDEQRGIVRRIKEETNKLDKVRAATERMIALLRERRAALIAAAVTGQIDVGEFAA